MRQAYDYWQDQPGNTHSTSDVVKRYNTYSQFKLHPMGNTSFWLSLVVTNFLPLPIVVKLSNSINDHIAFSHTNFVSNIFKQLPLPQTHSCFNYTKGVLVAEIYFTLISILTRINRFKQLRNPSQIYSM